MKIVTVIGARPQFIKAAMVSHAIAKKHPKAISEILVHTGQHYDASMSNIFFDQMSIPKPNYNLGIHAVRHGEMTGRMLTDIEPILISEAPDVVIVYGDTNSTIAAALASSKLGIDVAHIEAGLRSYDRAMPEEINRVLTDHLSKSLFCPSPQAEQNLKTEGITDGVHVVGDVMLDAHMHFNTSKVPTSIDNILHELNGKDYALATIHRSENTDNKLRLEAIFEGLKRVASRMTVILPLHPRTSKMLNNFKVHLDIKDTIQVINPVGYIEMLKLQKHSRVIITDSGGLQKEAYFSKVPCVTIRETTEWNETISAGWNTLCKADPDAIFATTIGTSKGKQDSNIFGKGNTAQLILDTLIG